MKVRQNDGTGRDLVDHWTWAARRGLLNENTAGALRAACSQVLAVEGDAWEELDVRRINVDDILRRFENLRKKDFTPQSLATYKSRFKKAVELYLAYLEDPSSWKPGIQPRRTGVDRPKQTGKRSEAPGLAANGSDLVEYPFPLREGVMAKLWLPQDLKRGEAKRLAAFLESLAMDEPLSLPRGREEQS